MAMAVVAPTSIASSGPLFALHRNDLGAIYQQPHHRGPAVSPRNPFEAFAPHHHSGAKSRSSAASWRNSEPVARAPLPIPPPASLVYRRPGPSHVHSHSHTASTSSSETSNGSWRSHIQSPAAPMVNLEPKRSDSSLKASSRGVYSISELLQLSVSPLVGMSKESQLIVDDLVAHHVWRRGPRPRTLRRIRDGTSQPRSSHSSTDDSEHSD